MPLPGPVGLSAAPDDILRSIRRWLSLFLDEPWDLRYQRDEDADRPSGLVVPSTPIMSAGGNAYVVHYERGFDVFLYPEGVEGDPAASRVKAEQLAYVVDKAFRRGLKVNGAYVSYSHRLPMWDHADVAWDQDIPADRAPFDHMPIRGISVNPQVDPDDDTLFTVVVIFTASWTADGDTRRLEGAVLQDIQRTPRLS